jgi:sugar transferase (PEP-CTERM/EpsH1 system associated)
MHLLWVKMGGLWPPTTGGRLRSLQIVSQLSQRHDVTVVTTAGADDEPEGLRAALPHCRDVVSIPHRQPKRATPAFAASMVRSWFSSFPVDLWKWRVAALRRWVDAHLASGSVDLAVADFLFAAANVPTGGRVPVVLFEHNVEHLIWQRLAAIESRVWRRPFLELEWRKLRRAEAAACAAADLTIAVSREDQSRLQSLAPAATIAVVPTGVDTSYFIPVPGREVPGRLVFSGSMDWHPNEDAMLAFVDGILPRIRDRVPYASLTIVGRNPSARVRELAHRPGVSVTGTVDDVRPHLDAAEVFVVPLRAGSGTRLKIFEAMAMAKPVVSTTLGAEGLGLAPEREIVLADSADRFADAVVALLADRSRRRTLGETGRTLVDTRYSWAQVARRFEACCATLALRRNHDPVETPSRPDLSRA